MATRRLAASTVEWAELARKIPEAQRASFLAMKGKTDGYVRTITGLPEKLPAIDWTVYSSRITVPGNDFNLFCSTDSTRDSYRRFRHFEIVFFNQLPCLKQIYCKVGISNFLKCSSHHMMASMERRILFLSFFIVSIFKLSVEVSLIE